MQVRSQRQDRDKRLTRDMQEKKKKRGADEERELKEEEEKSRGLLLIAIRCLFVRYRNDGGWGGWSPQ